MPLPSIIEERLLSSLTSSYHVRNGMKANSSRICLPTTINDRSPIIIDVKEGANLIQNSSSAGRLTSEIPKKFPLHRTWPKVTGRYVARYRAKLGGGESRWNSTRCSGIFVTDGLLIECTANLCTCMRKNWLDDFVSFRRCLVYTRNEIFTQRTYKSFKIDKQLEKKLSALGISDIKDLIVNREPACGTRNQGSSEPRICKCANPFFQSSNGDENRNLISLLLCRIIMAHKQESRELP